MKKHYEKPLSRAFSTVTADGGCVGGLFPGGVACEVGSGDYYTGCTTGILFSIPSCTTGYAATTTCNLGSSAL